MATYNLTPQHLAILERDKRRLDRNEDLLIILAKDKVHGVKPIRWNDYTSAQRVKLHELINKGFVIVKACPAGSICEYWVKLTEKGLAEIFVDFL